MGENEGSKVREGMRCSERRDPSSRWWRELVGENDMGARTSGEMTSDDA